MPPFDLGVADLPNPHSIATTVSHELPTSPATHPVVSNNESTDKPQSSFSHPAVSNNESTDKLQTSFSSGIMSPKSATKQYAQHFVNNLLSLVDDANSQKERVLFGQPITRNFQKAPPRVTRTTTDMELCHAAP